jgi:hypothetical protein
MDTEQLKMHRIHMQNSVRLLIGRLNKYDRYTKARAEQTILNLRKQIEAVDDQLIMRGEKP